MKFSLDKYAYLDSLIHRWYQPLKIVSLLTLIFAFALVNQLGLLPVMLVVTAIFYKISRLPLSFLLSRLHYPSLFLLFMVLLLPFVSGKIILWQWGWLAIKQEGCLSLLRIVTRFVCILTLGLVLFGTAPFLTSIKALRSLHIPANLVDMMLLTYRYLEELADILTNMQRAIKLRGFQAQGLNRRTIKILAQLMGTLLIRSYEQSRRVYQAMLLRGYNYQKALTYQGTKLSNHSLNRTLTGLTLSISLAFILAEVIW